MKYSLDLECLGVAVRREHTHVWGSSPVIGPDGRVHLYVAQWPRPVADAFGGETAVGQPTGWTVSSEIAHYVGDDPCGPFSFVRMAVPNRGGSFNAPHNPTVVSVDGRYVLLFIVNEGSTESQRIIMYVADDLSDNWQPAAGAEPDGTILRKSANPACWDHVALLGNSNPSLVKHGGGYKLYFKAVIALPASAGGQKNGRTWTYGVALSDSLEGPYAKAPERVIRADLPVEDASVFAWQDRLWMLTRDMNEACGGGGLLWVSEDGMDFDYDSAVLGFHHLDHYIGAEAARDLIPYRGSAAGHLERPQVLFENGQPAFLYMATGLGFPAPYGACSYVFRMAFRGGPPPEA